MESDQKNQKTSELFATIDSIFNSNSVAVVGASDETFSFGFHFMRYLVDSGYKGNIFPVNPKKKEILNYQAYADLTLVPGNIDYVICCIRADLVTTLIDQCLKKKVKVIHLLTGRFSETGDPEAHELEKQILAKAQKAGIRLIGPNCMGIYAPKSGISFNHDLSMESGKVGGICQSGGVAGEIVRYASLRGVKFSKVISYGNALDLNESDLLEYFYLDQETKVIFIYIEGAKDGLRFFKILKKTSMKKPVILLKGGKSSAGQKATISHTASIAGKEGAWDAACRQSNTIRASCIDELIDLLVAFDKLPAILSKKTGIIGGGGGKGILAADECENAGLNVIDLPDDVEKFIVKKDPSMSGWLGNPVDFSIVSGSKIDTIEMLNILSLSPGIDILLAILTEDNPFDEIFWTEFINKEVENYIKIASNKSKPFAVVMGNPRLNISDVENWRWKAFLKAWKKLQESNIPIFTSTKTGANAISKVAEFYMRMEKRASIPQMPETKQEKTGTILSEIEAKQAISKAGIAVNKTFFAKTKKEAIDLSEKIGFPVVFKIVAPTITHKTDVGGVCLNIKTSKDAGDAYDKVTAAAGENEIFGIAVQKMIPQGIELVAGMSRDLQFGPMLMFGIGGVHVEIIKDVIFAIAPLDKEGAMEMISGIKNKQILNGFRGQEPVNKEEIADLLVKLSDYVMLNHEIEEIDINPIIATPAGLVAVDARIIKH